MIRPKFHLSLAVLLLIAVSLIPALCKEKAPAVMIYDIVIAKAEGNRYSLSFYQKGKKVKFGLLADDFYRTPEDEKSPIFLGTWQRSTTSKETPPRSIRTSKICFYDDHRFDFVEIEARLVREGDYLDKPRYTESKKQETYGTWEETGRLRGRLTVKL